MNDSLRDTIVAKSDQLNADDLVGGPITVTILDVVRNKSKDQPVSVVIDGGHQPYKPNLTMRRVLISAWGDRGKEWIGKSLILYRNPNVKWGGKCVGGIEISHMSHIECAFDISLAVTRGKKALYSIKKLELSQDQASDDSAAELDKKWVAYCSEDVSRLDEISDATYRAKIKGMIAK